MQQTRRIRNAFNLMELLIVIAILTLLTLFLFSVISHVRDKQRQTVCLSNEHQIGIALLQYAQDFDDNLPSGTQGSGGRSGPANNEVALPGGNGVGWAGQIFSYAKNTAIFQCPSEGDFQGQPGLRNTPGALSPQGVIVSYGYNNELPRSFSPRHVGGLLTRINAPSEMVMLFEVSGDVAAIQTLDENVPSGVKVHSSAGDGWYNPSVGSAVWGNVYGVRYATGDLGGVPHEPTAEYAGVKGRHSGGSNFLLVDGHAKWFKPQDVFPTGRPANISREGYKAYFINRDR